MMPTPPAWRGLCLSAPASRCRPQQLGHSREQAVAGVWLGNKPVRLNKLLHHATRDAATRDVHHRHAWSRLGGHLSDFEPIFAVFLQPEVGTKQIELLLGILDYG